MTSSRNDAHLEAVSLLDEPVRRRLYEWVVRQGRPVGREEAAKAVAISRGLATFHLDKLADAGLLDAGYQRLTGRVGPGAGRPARVYRRATSEFRVSIPERRYDRAAELFATALEKLSAGAVPAPLQAAAVELGEELARNTEREGGTPPLLAALEAGGYEPQADEDGTIRLLNCPFHALVDEHRSLVCGTNLALAEGMSRGVGASGLRPVLDPQPGYCCVTFVPESSSPSRATVTPDDLR